MSKLTIFGLKFKLWMIAFIAGAVVVAFWLQQHMPPVYVWIGFFIAIAGIIMFSFIPYYRRSFTSIELFFDKDKCILKSPIYETNPHDGSRYSVLSNIIYMVGIKSTNNQVDNVEVKLISIQPKIGDFGELVINPRGIVKGMPSTFSINREDTKYVEVIEWYEPLSEAGIHSYENYHVGTRPIETNIPEGKYIFTLQATGKDISSCKKQFQIIIDNKHGINFGDIK